MGARLRHCTMSEENELSDPDELQERLSEVQVLLARHKLVEDLVHRQEGPRHDLVEDIVHKQHLNELKQKLEPMHPADIAHILEALPPEERLIVWDLVDAELDGFDTVGDALDISYVQMARYLEATDVALGMAVSNGLLPSKP